MGPIIDCSFFDVYASDMDTFVYCSSLQYYPSMFLVPAKIKTLNWYICKIYVEESTDQRIPEAVIFLTCWFHKKNKHVCKV
ncbi:hypothetical protein Hanom_Chr17g01544161 [Helianthus anomalus]